MATSPIAVSAAIRRAGWLPTPAHTRFIGVHVQRSWRKGEAVVSCTWEHPTRNNREATAIKEHLESLGYTVEVRTNEGDFISMLVTRES